MDLDKEIDRALGAIMGGDEDPRQILKNFARTVRGQDTLFERIVPSCAVCKEKDALCFRCTVKEKIGEKAMDSLPAVYLFVRQWYEQSRLERAQRAQSEQAEQAHRAAQEASAYDAARRRPPPPPPGKQTF